MKNVKVRGKDENPRKKTNSTAKRRILRQIARLVKTQIPRLGSKFRGPRKTVGPNYLFHSLAALPYDQSTVGKFQASDSALY